MIGDILKSLRIDNGLTQKELSEKLNIGQATIACYENGQREPHISNLNAYADFFECSIDYLVGRADELGCVTIDIKNTSSFKREKSNEKLIDKISKLNKEKRDKVEGYVDALLNN
ncbi:MAG: helix-turn-helix transcriptional regulator [Clostridia bacterium]|nr:helix-turn-helix transcriptional regulator [Clostridia bacterium]